MFDLKQKWTIIKIRKQKLRFGGKHMKIAVTHENGTVFQHFGHTESFKIYEVIDGEVKSMRVVSTNGSGHGALAGFLKDSGVDTLICGGIGGGAKNALAEAGITIYPGVKGACDKAVLDFVMGKLQYDPDTLCSHHDHDHGDHDCGSHSCH
jgi:predicted Fe-Mo cluster-binding NifX family protein